MADDTPQPNATALRVLEILRPHTPFAEAIVRRQAERIGKTVATLTSADLPSIAPQIVAASALFIDPPALARLKLSLGVK